MATQEQIRQHFFKGLRIDQLLRALTNIVSSEISQCESDPQRCDTTTTFNRTEIGKPECACSIFVASVDFNRLICALYCPAKIRC